MSGRERHTVHLICHTHWDREWYLPEAAFRPRLVSAVADLFTVLEREPDARFVLDGQTVLLDDVHAVIPGWRSRSAAAAQSGQLDVGPWYILADELVPSGESMIRNLLEGNRDARDHGRRMDVLYSPDAFGHPSTLPTLASEFGIGAGVVWRGLAPASGRDTDLYWWNGPDGTRLLLYHLPPSGYEIGAGLLEPEDRLASEWSRIKPIVTGRAATAEVAVFVGADHHAPPSDPVAIRDVLRRLDPTCDFRLSSLSEYFAAVRQAASVDRCRAMSGELRWSFGHTWTLPGARAVRSRMLRRFGATELLLLRKAECLAALVPRSTGHVLHELVGAARRTLLQCQFHDTLCGCCSDLVAREQGTRLTTVASLSDEISRAALHRITGHDPDLARTAPGAAQPAMILWNPAARLRGGIVTAVVTVFRRDIFVGPPTQRIARTGEGFAPFALSTPDGTPMPVQVLSVMRGLERIDAAHHYPDLDEVDRVTIAFAAPTVPGLGIAILTPIAFPADPAPTDLEVSATRLANRFVEVHCERDGRVDLVDRRSGEHYRDILRMVDERDLGDTYTPDIAPDDPLPLAPTGVPRVLAAGPLVGAIDTAMIVNHSTGRITVRRILILHAESPVLRIRLEVDNQARDHRLRIAIPVGAGSNLTSGAAFGFEDRSPADVDLRRFPAEHPLRTAPAQRFAAVSEGNRGVALFCPGFFEYEWTDRTLSLTLIRSVGELSKPDLRTRPGHAGWPIATPEAQEPGLHAIEFAITPIDHDDGLRIDALEALWEEIFLPLQPDFIRAFTGKVGTSPVIGAGLEGDGLVFSACKHAESGDGVVLRCYNPSPTPVRGRWIMASPLAAAMRIRADETAIESLAITSAGVEIVAPPRALVTVLVQFAA
ncbi:MAG TPA: glycoside hydrolase family 38 C-terminal domain-containing protein [Gemmatimonadales bacterium]|jgi:hypothetical protein